VLSAKENEWQMSMFDKTQYIVEQKLVAIWDTYGAKDVNGNLLGYAIAMDHLEQKAAAQVGSGKRLPLDDVSVHRLAPSYFLYT